MKDSKSLLLLVVSVLLILVSFALLWSWGYNLGNQKSEKQGTVYILKDSTQAANEARDSLAKVYSTTIQNLGLLDSSRIKADSLKSDLSARLAEFYQLRDEISGLLKNPVTKADLDIAKQKIDELQRKIDELRDRNTDIEKENKKLYALLSQLTQNQKQSVQNSRPVIPADTRISSASERNNAGAAFSASELRLAAFMVDEGREQETYMALQTDKFVGTFVVKNNTAQAGNGEIMVVLMQPDGKVVKPSAWDVGSFETSEGRKIYSCKVRFEYAKGEAKRLSFTVNADKCVKGNYTVQLYQNGVMIGRMSKSLI